MIYFVSICNIVTAIAILVAWILRSRSLPRKFVWQMSLRYVRFYLVYALMMNRYIRFRLWLVDKTGNDALPYWPLTKAELGMILIYLVLWVINLLIYLVYKYRNNEEILYSPFSLVNLFYPTMLLGNKLAKGEITTKLLACFSSMIWIDGVLYFLATSVFSLKNVR